MPISGYPFDAVMQSSGEKAMSGFSLHLAQQHQYLYSSTHSDCLVWVHRFARRSTKQFIDCCLNLPEKQKNDNNHKNNLI